MAVLVQGFGVVADDVFGDAAYGALAGGDGYVLPACPLYGGLADAYRHPHGGPGLLHRAGPDGHVVVGPELAFVREGLVLPSVLHHLEGLFEPGTRLPHIHVVHQVLAGDAPHDASDEAPFGEAVHHGDFFSESQGGSWMGSTLPYMRSFIRLVHWEAAAAIRLGEFIKP